MTQLADDTVAHAEKIAESDACRSRLAELVQNTFDVDNQFDLVVSTLRQEFIDDDPHIKNDVPVVGNLLEKAFERRVGELYRDELEQIVHSME